MKERNPNITPKIVIKSQGKRKKKKKKGKKKKTKKNKKKKKVAKSSYLAILILGVPTVEKWVKNLTAEAQVAGSIPHPGQGVKGSRFAAAAAKVAAVAQIQTLSQELPYALGVAIKNK